jgi:hypothetical protein
MALISQIGIDPILRPNVKGPIALLAGILGVGFGGVKRRKTDEAKDGNEECFHEEWATE